MACHRALGRVGRLRDVVPVEPPGAERRFGFLAGQGVVAADLKRDFEAEVEAMFGLARTR